MFELFLKKPGHFQQLTTLDLDALKILIHVAQRLDYMQAISSEPYVAHASCSLFISSLKLMGSNHFDTSSTDSYQHPKFMGSPLSVTFVILF